METESPFKPMLPKSPNLLEQLLGWQPKENSIIALNNLLADASRVRYVTHEDIQNIINFYKVNVYRDFHKELEQLYRQFLDHCFVDKVMTAEEIRDLSHLKHLLGLNDQTVQAIHNETVAALYEKTIDEVLTDGRLSTEEREFLNKLERELTLPDEIARRIFSAKAKEYIQRYADNVTADQRLSPEEDQELAAIAKSLGIEITYNEQSKAALEKLRLFWLIENGDIPEVGAGINLQADEKCYFACNIDWLEHRRARVRSVSTDILTQIDYGRTFLTNKRILFIGAHKTITIPLADILDFVVYKDGIEIRKNSGRNPTLRFHTGVDIFAGILKRVLRTF